METDAAFSERLHDRWAVRGLFPFSVMTTDGLSLAFYRDLSQLVPLFYFLVKKKEKAVWDGFSIYCRLI